MSKIILEGVDTRLIDYAHRNGLKITAGKNGKHNIGSKHPIGKAIDFSIHKTNGELISEEYWGHLHRDAAENGMRLIDERKRLPGEKVWSGPHGHLETLD